MVFVDLPPGMPHRLRYTPNAYFPQLIRVAVRPNQNGPTGRLPSWDRYGI